MYFRAEHDSLVVVVSWLSPEVHDFVIPRPETAQGYVVKQVGYLILR
jgi:hypothetical protein